MVSENTEPTVEEVTQTAPVEVQPTAESRVFTQDDVNRLQGQARREERAKFNDYQTLKDRAAKADEMEQAQLTEQEKLVARAEEAEKRITDASQRIASAMISSEVKVKASQMGIIDPEAAYLLIDRTNVRYVEDSGVTGVEDALTQLLEDKPYLKGTPNRAPNLNPQTGEPAPTLRLTEDQREAARLMGMSEEDYARGI